MDARNGLTQEFLENILDSMDGGVLTVDTQMRIIIARVTFHIPDKGQVTVRYYGLYANAHRGTVKKASLVPVALGMIEEEMRSI